MMDSLLQRRQSKIRFNIYSSVLLVADWGHRVWINVSFRCFFKLQYIGRLDWTLTHRTSSLIESSLPKPKSAWFFFYSEGSGPTEPSACHFMQNAACDWLSFHFKWWALTGLTFCSEQQALIGEEANTRHGLISSRTCTHTHTHSVLVHIANIYAHGQWKKDNSLTFKIQWLRRDGTEKLNK